MTPDRTSSSRLFKGTRSRFLSAVIGCVAGLAVTASAQTKMSRAWKILIGAGALILGATVLFLVRPNKAPLSVSFLYPTNIDARALVILVISNSARVAVRADARGWVALAGPHQPWAETRGMLPMEIEVPPCTEQRIPVRYPTEEVLWGVTLKVEPGLGDRIRTRIAPWLYGVVPNFGMNSLTQAGVISGPIMLSNRVAPASALRSK